MTKTTRKVPQPPGEIIKTFPIIRDLSLNPKCQHGPTILFDCSNGKRFFACSAYRNRKLCPFYMPEEQWTAVSSSEDIATTDKHSDDGRTRTEVVHRSKLKSGGSEGRLPLLPPAMQNNQGEAQYHFSDETVQFFVDLFKTVKVTHVICVGTPTLYSHLLRNHGVLRMDTFLLDIDERLISGCESSKSALYNMFNHHFFEGEGRRRYEDFLRNADSLIIVADPPFGVKSELLWNGALKCIGNDFKCLSKNQHGCCEIIWVFPYFMEGHILRACTGVNIQMSDYKIMYKNHTKFKAKKLDDPNGVNDKTSPVRIFTTIPLSSIRLPEGPYRYCDACGKWVNRKNLHCDLCETCPTKDGGETYIHCNKCGKCVKPTWSHCDIPCHTCHLKTAKCRVRSNLPTSSAKDGNIYKNTVNVSKSNVRLNMKVKKKNKKRR